MSGTLGPSPVTRVRWLLGHGGDVWNIYVFHVHLSSVKSGIIICFTHPIHGVCNMGIHVLFVIIMKSCIVFNVELL